MSLPQMGGIRMSVADEVQIMSGHFILLGLVLTSVYVSRIPESVLLNFRRGIYQFISFVAIIAITMQYGWVHGILAGLAFALILGRANRATYSEGLVDYIPSSVNMLVIEDPDTTYIPGNHRWFVERALGERPFLIREKEVRTTAVQDLSERSMGSSTTTR